MVDFPQFLRWFLPLSAVALSACAGAQERPEPHPQLPDIGFHYDLRASQSGDLQVILSIRAPILPEMLRVAFPDRVAGRTGLFEAISAIDARDENGERLGLIVEDGSVYIGCGDARVVHVHYQVAPPDRELTHSSRFRAIGSDSRFFSFGHAIIAQPLDLNPELDRAVQVTTHTEDGNWQIQATIPLDEPYPITALVDAGFFAGEFEHVRRVRGGRSVDLWVEETIANQPQMLADLALAVVEAQAHLLGDDAEHTRVIALQRADDEHARTGSGRAGGFVLELGDAVDARTDGLAELIAHENFHRLNGHTLRFASREELATMWFREGVTDYVAMRNAADNGVIAESAFFRYLGRSLAAYLTNPAREVPMAEFEHRFWTNRDLQRFPYDHGSIAALLIDLELRRSGEDIEAFFTFLRTDGSVRVLPLTNSAIRDALERFSRSSWTAFFDAYIVGGQPFEVFESLNAVGLEVVERVEPAAYYGFRTSVTVDGTWFVSSVDSGSPSAQAGVFPGMELRSDPYVPMHAIDGIARLEEVTNRGWRTIEVRALRGQRRAFALTAEGEEYRAAFGFHGE